MFHIVFIRTKNTYNLYPFFSSSFFFWGGGGGEGGNENKNETCIYLFFKQETGNIRIIKSKSTNKNNLLFSLSLAVFVHLFSSSNIFLAKVQKFT